MLSSKSRFVHFLVKRRRLLLKTILFTILLTNRQTNQFNPLPDCSIIVQFIEIGSGQDCMARTQQSINLSIIFVVRIAIHAPYVWPRSDVINEFKHNNDDNWFFAAAQCLGCCCFC